MPVIALPCAVLPTENVDAAAAALGISVHDVLAIAHGGAALRDGEVVDEVAFFHRFPDDDFGDFTSADAIAARAPDLVERSIELARDSYEHLAAPISARDVAALALIRTAHNLARLVELHAPEILVRHAKSLVAGAFERARSAAPAFCVWRPLGELMTGAPALAGAHRPSAMFGDSDADDLLRARDAAVLPEGVLVMFPLASVVLGDDGAVRDVFPTCGLRPIASHGGHILLVCGGGPAAQSGYFGVEAIVRDTAARAWVEGALPAGLPRFVAGTVGDVKWAIVADVVEARGYRSSPDWIGDQCGGTFNSACGAFTHDGNGFVLEASTGAPVVDIRALGDAVAVTSFARRRDGAWRFVTILRSEEDERDAWRIVDETGRVILEGESADACVLAPDGARALVVDGAAARMIDVDSGATTQRIDLGAILPALAPIAPDDKLGRRALASYGVAAAVARATPAEVRAGIADTFGDEPSDDDLALLIERARSMPVAAVGEG